MNPLNVCSWGSLVRANSRNGFAISTGTGLQPGQGLRSEITIVNLGSLAGAFRLAESDALNEFAAGRLALAINELHEGEAGRRIFLGEVGQLPADGIDLGRFEAGESRTYRFTVFLAKDTPASERGGSASAIYAWSTVPLPSVVPA